MAASASLLREVQGFYRVMGEQISQVLTNGNVPGFFLMDFVLEESLELIAASMIFVGIIMYWKVNMGNRKNI